MHLFWSLFFLGLALVPPVVADGFTLPHLDNLESHLSQLWKNFLNGYGIVYNTTVEEVHRFQIFTDHVKLIIKHNLEHDLGLHTYRLGINKYAAMVSALVEPRCDRRVVALRSRPTPNFDDSSTGIVSRRTIGANTPRFDMHTSLPRPTALFPCLSIGAIKA